MISLRSSSEKSSTNWMHLKANSINKSGSITLLKKKETNWKQFPRSPRLKRSPKWGNYNSYNLPPKVSLSHQDSRKSTTSRIVPPKEMNNHTTMPLNLKKRTILSNLIKLMNWKRTSQWKYQSKKSRWQSSKKILRRTKMRNNSTTKRMKKKENSSNRTRKLPRRRRLMTKRKRKKSLQRGTSLTKRCFPR